MTKDTEEQVAVKVEAAAAMAKSLAMDLRKGLLWEGDFERRLGAMQEEINLARNLSGMQT